MNASSLTTELSCVYNPKTHLICIQPVYFECACSILPENLPHSESKEKTSHTRTFVACLKCILEQCDYAGKFRCPNPGCLNELKKSAISIETCENQRLVELKQDYERKIKTKLYELATNCASKSLKMSRDLKGLFELII